MNELDFMGQVLLATWGFFQLPLLREPVTITLGGFLIGSLVVTTLFSLIRSLVLGADHD